MTVKICRFLDTVVADYRLIKPPGCIKTVCTKVILFAFMRKMAALEMHASCNIFNDSSRVSIEL